MSIETLDNELELTLENTLDTGTSEQQIHMNRILIEENLL